MNNCYTAITKKDGNWWIGWIEEVPGINCQEQTREDLLKSLKTILKEALEFNRMMHWQQQEMKYTAASYVYQRITYFVIPFFLIRHSVLDTESRRTGFPLSRE